MPLSIPGPATFIGVAGRGVDSLERAISLVPRVATLVASVEEVLVRIDLLVTDIETTRAQAQAVVERTDDTAGRAAELVARTGPLLDDLAPALEKMEPTITRLADTTDPDEVAAIVAMLDLLPDLVARFRDDIVPVLDTMGTVAPDLRDLLDVSRELNGMLAALPGLGRVRRRVEDKQELEDAHTATETPPPAPDRG